MQQLCSVEFELQNSTFEAHVPWYKADAYRALALHLTYLPPTIEHVLCM